MTYAQDANAEAQEATRLLEDHDAPFTIRAVEAQIHATLAVAYATLAVSAEAYEPYRGNE